MLQSPCSCKVTGTPQSSCPRFPSIKGMFYKDGEADPKTATAAFCPRLSYLQLCTSEKNLCKKDGTKKDSKDHKKSWFLQTSVKTLSSFGVDRKQNVEIQSITRRSEALPKLRPSFQHKEKTFSCS
ncbi:hypothetical protein FQA47_013039 [Oryzias melastigma]|uniref:Uncharacterized protein n=1 Tax=Oryzias melastigma TaxID=30732 RepID=A0A834FP13_ORYME|nr:hypothetical protein FQA47_013039 [Oryzias melastigma]